MLHPCDQQRFSSWLKSEMEDREEWAAAGGAAAPDLTIKTCRWFEKHNV